MPITALPTPVPQTSDPANFDTRADALLTALPTFVTEANALEVAVDADAAATATNAAAAAVSATSANLASGAAVAATNYAATSVSSHSFTVGSKAFTLAQTGKAFAVADRVTFIRRGDSAARMRGTIDTWDGVSVMTVTIDYVSTTGGPHTDWFVILSALEAPLVTGRQSLWIPAGAMTARTTNGAASGSVETTTNKVMLKTLDFDASTIEYSQFTIRMPKAWNEGTVTFVPEWKHAATATNFKVSWGLQAVALSDDDAADAAFGTAIYSNDTGGTTNDVYPGPESAAVTIAGAPAAEDLVMFQVLRKADDATNDTMAIDAGLLGVTLYITTDTGTDA